MPKKPLIIVHSLFTRNGTGSGKTEQNGKKERKQGMEIC
jgi:hypothetical protein